VECPRCGLAYVNPRPLNEHFLRVYEEDYFSSAAGGVGYEDYIGFAEQCWGQGRAPELDMLELVRPLRNRRLLEIGCATGELLALARARGAHTLGLDLSPQAACLARERHGLEVRRGAIEDAGLPAQAFDVVLALEVIEHVISPTRFLAQIARLLMPNGLAALSTPNYRHGQRCGKQWQGFHTSFEHLYFLSSGVLMRMAAAHGLDLLFWATTGNGLVPPSHQNGRLWRALLKKIPGLARCHRFLRPAATFAPWEFFGEGHRLFMVFKLTEPGGSLD